MRYGFPATASRPEEFSSTAACPPEKILLAEWRRHICLYCRSRRLADYQTLAGNIVRAKGLRVQATAELGSFDKSLDMLHRFRHAFTSAIPQAIELTKVEGQAGLQARVSTRAGASFAEVSGSFAEVIINTSFGFRPAPDGKTTLWQSQVPRGFKGQLRHVRWNTKFYTIISDNSGLHLEKE